MWRFFSSLMHRTCALLDLRAPCRAASPRRAPPRPAFERLEDRLAPAAGALDPAFGAGGTVLTSFSTGIMAENVAIQGDGKIIVAGTAANGSSQSFALARYHADGSLDPTFGQAGFSLIGDLDGLFATGMALQADGKIVVAGSVLLGASSDFAVLRLNADGSRDLGFGVLGLTTVDFRGGADEASSVTIQKDGRIVVAGRVSFDGEADFALTRLNRSGRLDRRFGRGGKVLIDFASGSDELRSVALQSDGKIVAAGHAHFLGQSEFALARLTRNGRLDRRFGHGGKVLTDIGFLRTEASSVAVQPDGHIVVAGYSGPDGDQIDFTLLRYRRDGSLDTSFGSGGKVVTDVAPGAADGALAVVLQPDGKIVAAGGAWDGGDFDFALLRYNRDGSLDADFGTGGTVLTDLVAGESDVALALTLQSDGKIVAAGGASGSQDNDIALARYLAS